MQRHVAAADALGRTFMPRLALRRKQPCRGHRNTTRASTSFDILFQNESPYLLKGPPGAKPLIQMTTVVKVMEPQSWTATSTLPADS